MKKMAVCLVLAFLLVSCANSPPTPYPTYTPYPTFTARPTYTLYPIFTPSPTQSGKIEILETTTYRVTIDSINNLVINGLIQNVGEISLGVLDFSVMCKGFYSDGRLADVDERSTKPDTLEPGEQGIFASYLEEWKPGQACCPKIDRYSCEIIFYDW